MLPAGPSRYVSCSRTSIVSNFEATASRLISAYETTSLAYPSVTVFCRWARLLLHLLASGFVRLSWLSFSRPAFRLEDCATSTIQGPRMPLDMRCEGVTLRELPTPARVERGTYVVAPCDKQPAPEPLRRDYHPRDSGVPLGNHPQGPTLNRSTDRSPALMGTACWGRTPSKFFSVAPQFCDFRIGSNVGIDQWHHAVGFTPTSPRRAGQASLLASSSTWKNAAGG